MLLHWSTDSLLLDDKPIKYNNWETANTLIQKKGLEAVLTKDLAFKNLYGIMVRKIDFVRTKSSDRIIARFPFIVLNEEIKDQIRNDILLISEKVRDYFYQSINKSIIQWKTIILNYLEKGTLPYPIFRCCFELKPNLHALVNETSLRFTSARGEAFTFPTRLTNKLAYLCGICNGDGNLRDYWIIVADETKEHIEFISNMLNELFSKKGKLMKTGGAWIVKLNLLWAVRLFNFLTDQAIDKPKYDSLSEPLIFQQLGEPYRSLYWRGVFDADGSFKNQIVFSSISEIYTLDFQKYLLVNNIKSNFYSKKMGGYQLNITAKDKFRFANLIGSCHIKKQNDFLAFLTRSTSIYQFKGFNSANMIRTNYFNFELLPQASVLGLDDYFQLSKDFTSFFTQKEIKRYREGKGVTIRKLTTYLKTINLDLMPFLNNKSDLLKFRSYSSSELKLPLQPTNTLNELLLHLIPTAKGAKLYQKTPKLIELRKQLFGIVTNSSKTSNQLLRKFLQTYGLYKEEGKKLLEKKLYLTKWYKKLDV